MEYEIYKKRIKKVQSQLKDGETLLLFAATHLIRNRDVEYKFRQDSDFFYLTGITEPDGILVLKKSYSSLFVLPKDKEKEIWTGIRIGKKEAKRILSLDEAFETTEWNDKSVELLTNTFTLFHFFGKDKERDSGIIAVCEHLNKRSRIGQYGPHRIEIPDFLHEMRLIKSKEEIQSIQESVKITMEGHLALFQETKPGMYEYELEAILEREYLKRGAWGGGYGHIVASGANATILHYTFNNCKIKKGDLLLIDSGAEKDYYTADVTRVYPADKKFTSAQRDVYEVVLDAQKRAITNTIAGKQFLSVHEETVRDLCIGLKYLKLIKGSVESVMEKGDYKKFYMHKTGHWLGMDVHDVGKYFQNGESRKLVDGMVTTVEPGLYFDPSDKSIPKHFRGIGIRIEDDILVNGKKPINLTSSIPKEVAEIEAIRQTAF
ncbi:MAG TPA: aminopeptidase P N-terminal domain-containing protein [Leptospiraceae bacterium]|nr:aminopeptidase P N-terminal domain-containing protein [Leptospiraceae bacterium]HRG75031.1 aminopeptidase P N-terminal domain-containing protein [Leptospiraceae bacterium]